MSLLFFINFCLDFGGALHGSYKWLSWNSFPYIEEKVMYGVARDITERKKSEEKLKHFHCLMQYIIEHNRSAVAVHDKDLKYIYVSQRYLEEYRVKEKDIIGKHHYEVFPDLPQKWRDAHQKALVGIVSSAEDDPYYREDGTEDWTRWECRPWYEADGSIGGIIIYTEVITERKKAEAAIKENEERIRLLLNSAAEAICGIDLEGKVTFCNPATLKILGYDDENDLIGKRFHIIVHHSDHFKNSLELRKCKIGKVLSTGEKVYARDEFFMKSDGCWFNVEYWSYPVFKDGKINGAVVTFLDITDRMEAEEALKQSEQKMRSIFRAAPTGIGVVVNRVFIDVNSRVCEMTGYIREELIGRNARMLYPTQEEYEFVGSEKYKMIRERGTGVVETRWITKAGKIINIILSSTPIEEGDLLKGVIFNALDITERKLAEEALISSEERFRKLIENSPIGIYYVSLDGKFIYGNKAAEDIIGYKKNELIGKNFLTTNLLSLRDLPKATKLFAKNILGIFSGPERFELKRKNGKPILTEITTQMIDIHGQKVVMGMVQDITERLQSEIKIRESEARLNEAQIIGNYGYWDYFIKQNKVIWSENTYRLYGLEPYEMEIDIDYYRRRMHPDDLHRTDEGYEKIIKNKEPAEFDSRITNNDGEIRWLHNKVIPIFQDGELIRLFGTSQDITERKKAEEALIRSERRYRILFDANPHPMWVYDLETLNFLAVNDYAIEKYGYSREEFLQMKITDIRPQEDVKRLLEDVARPRNAISHSGEWRHKLKDGTIIYVDINSHIIDFENKKAVLVLALDITEKKRQEENLRESEEKFRNLFVNHAAIKLLIDPSTGDIVDANRAASKFYGWTTEELKKMNIASLNTLPVEEIKKEMAKVLPAKGVYFEFKHRKASGEIRDVEVYSSIITISGRDYIHSIIHDITEKKKIGVELVKRSRAIEQSPVSIIITNTEGKIEYVNPNFTVVTGYTFSEVFGKNASVLKSGEHEAEFYNNLWNIINAGKNWSGILHNKKKDGTLYWESAIISPIKDENGKITHFVSVQEDISDEVEKEIELSNYRSHLEELVEERTEELDRLNKDLLVQLEKEKELEKQLNAALEKEREVNELKTRFIATVSHEFRTPLAALLSSTQMIQRYSHKWSEAKLNEHYSRISNTINYLTQLLDDVLTISRADREILNNNPEEIDIDELIEAYYDEIKPMLSDKHEVAIINFCNHRVLSVDKKLLYHIIMNLLTNAIKYSPNGGKIELISIFEDDKLKVCVSDAGLGIPEDELKYVFQPFYRSRNAIGIQGSGLGLNIVKRCVDIMGGEISVKSKLNEGTTFCVTVPVYE